MLGPQPVMFLPGVFVICGACYSPSSHPHQHLAVVSCTLTWESQSQSSHLRSQNIMQSISKDIPTFSDVYVFSRETQFLVHHSKCDKKKLKGDA